jgi:hypothetical protein
MRSAIRCSITTVIPIRSCGKAVGNLADFGPDGVSDQETCQKLYSKFRKLINTIDDDVRFNQHCDDWFQMWRKIGIASLISTGIDALLVASNEMLNLAANAYWNFVLEES